MKPDETIASIADHFDGQVSLAAKDMASRRGVFYHADRKVPTASVIKLPILVHTLMLADEGALSLNEEVALRDEDRKPGSGVLKDLSAGLRLTLRDACMLMISVSDNTATNLVIERVGIEAVNARMQSLGCHQTRLFRKVFSEGPPISRENARYGLGVTSPRDMLRLLTMVVADSLGRPGLGREIRRYLAAQHSRDAIPRCLPADWSYEGKGGAVDAVRNDVGLVTAPDGGVIALAVFCTQMPTPAWTPDNPGLLAIARISRCICERFRPEIG